MLKVILDTDIGNDVDDSFALSYILKHPDMECLGVTTVSGEAFYRKKIAEAFVELVEKDIPVFEGFSKPIFSEELQPKCFQRLSNVLVSECASGNPGDAIKFMADTIRENPNEITLCAIGPLTNIAALCQMFPDTIPLIKHLIIMGTKLSSDVSDIGMLDWNTHCDVIALKKVLAEHFRKVTFVPCDVTYSVHDLKNVMNMRLKGTFAPLINQLSEGWFKAHNGFSYHDAITISVLTNPNLFEIQKGMMSFADDKSPILTQTVWRENMNGNHELVLSMEQDDVIDDIYNTISRI